MSGAEVTSPMEGVTGMMARLGHVPGCSRGGLYGPANIDFRFVMQLRLQRAESVTTDIVTRLTC